MMKMTGGIMKKKMLSLMGLLLMASFYGCNTVQGLGEDLTAVGGWISRGSEHVEESIKNNPPGSQMEK
jgi:predicted small secreted protein